MAVSEPTDSDLRLEPPSAATNLPECSFRQVVGGGTWAVQFVAYRGGGVVEEDR